MLPVAATVALVAVYANVVPLQIADGLNVLDKAGVGFIVIVAVSVNPEHPFDIGVTVIVPEICAFVVFVPINEAIFPVPLEPNPMFEFVFVQENVVPETLTELANVIDVEELALQIV